MRHLLLSAVLSVFFTVSAFAVNPGETLKDPALEERARSLSTELRCLVCQNQSIDDSNAPLAKDLRILLRERLTAGDSDDQVIKFLVDRYGEFILLRPKFGLHTLLLWLLPFALLLGGFVLVLMRRKRSAEAGAPASLSAKEKQRLKKLIG